MARSKGLNVPITSDATTLQREARKAIAAVETIDKAVQQLSGGTKGLSEQQRLQLVEQAKATAEAKRYQSALRTLGVDQKQVNEHLGTYSSHLGTGRKRAEEAVAANVALTGSIRSMARTAAGAGAGFLATYVGLSKAKDAVKGTEELAHSTEVLHRNTGLSVKSSSDWISVAQVRGIQANALNKAFQTLSKTFLSADAGQKQATQTLKALGITQGQVHAGARNFNTALGLTAGALGKAQGGTVRLTTAQQLLGRGAQTLIPLFAQGRKGLQDQMAMAQKYGVELNSRTLPLLNKLVANQREMKFASLGLKVAFTEAVAPGLLSVEKAGLRVVQVFRDPNLTSDQKWNKLGQTLGPLGTKLQHAFEQVLPKIANAAAVAAPHAASAFVQGFLHADIWGKLVLGSWLVHKFGGWSAFTGIGRKGGTQVAEGLAEGAAARGAVGKLSKAGAILGRVLGVAAAGYLVEQILAAIAKKFGKQAADIFNPSGSQPARQEQNREAPVQKALSQFNQASGGLLRKETHDGPFTIADVRAVMERAPGSRNEGQALIKALRTYATQTQGTTRLLDKGDIDKSRKALDAYIKSANNAKDATGKLHNAAGNTGPVKRGKRDTDLLAGSVGALAGKLLGVPPATTKAGQAAQRLGGNFNGLGSTVGSAAGKIAGVTNGLLSQFGAKKIDFQLGKSTGAAVGSLFKAGGGWIGSPGEAGGDNVPIMVGRGEAVLNRYQQAPVEMALRATYGMGLDDLFAQVQRPHYMAKGGRAGYASGGFVAEPGTNFSRGQEPQIVAHLRRLGASLHKTIYGISGYRSPAHSVAVGGFANDPHTQGIAADIGVGSPTLSSAGSVSEATYRRFGLYRPFYPADPHEINHVQLLAGAAHLPTGGSVGSSAGAMAAKIGRLKISGPGGPLHNIAQGATDRMRKAANAYLAKQGGGGGGGGGIGGSGSGKALMESISRQKGWNFGDWWYVDGRESSHGRNLANPTSTARLRGQFLNFNWGKYGPGSDPRKNPSMDQQIRSMALYIAKTYGNPTKAAAHERAFNWYARGGFVGRRFSGGGVAGAGFVNPISGPSGGSGGKPHRHWNPWTHTYQFVSTATFTAWQRKWQQQHPTLPMPGGPTKGSTANAPHPYVINGQTVMQTPAQHRAYQARQQRTRKHTQQVLSQFQGQTDTISSGADATIGSLDTRATGFDTAVQDQGTDYEFASRTLDQTADDTTVTGRAAHIAGIQALEGRKKRQELALAGKRKMYQEQVLAARAAIRRLMKERRRAPQKARKAIDAKIRHFQLVIKTAKRGAHQAGLDIAGNELDILGLEGDIKDVQSKAPTAIDIANEHIAQAALTPDGADDTAANAELVAASEGEYAAAVKSGDVARITAAAQGLDAARQQAGASQQALTDAITQLKASIDQQNAFAQSITAVTGREALRALSDVVNGNLGYRTQQRQGTPSYGSVYRA